MLDRCNIMQAKYDELTKAGVDIGNKISETTAYGGIVWDYERGRIHSYLGVAGGVANAIWGGILSTRRLALATSTAKLAPSYLGILLPMKGGTAINRNVRKYTRS